MNDINDFLSDNNLDEFYDAYNWGDDNKGSGFRDIVEIEKVFKKCKSQLLITRESIMLVVKWGKLRYPKRVICPKSIKVLNEEIANPKCMYKKLCKNIIGLGPTYISKIIRFICPERAGAIDTRIVRVFGKGDDLCSKHDWLELKVVNYGYGWYINKNQKNWPNAYFRWLDILTHLKKQLNLKGIQCPHPDSLVLSGLRKKGIWTCADVEMALFAYCSDILKKG